METVIAVIAVIAIASLLVQTYVTADDEREVFSVSITDRAGAVGESVRVTERD